MREIKFRGKNVVGGEWVYGYYKYNNITKEHIIQADDGVSYTVDPKTVGQYTDRKDKNGTKIYEHDILNIISVMIYEQGKEEVEEYVTDVVWEAEYTSFACSDSIYPDGEFDYDMALGSIAFGIGEMSWPLFEVEVIGNIFDNEDIIKKEKERRIREAKESENTKV